MGIVADFHLEWDTKKIELIKDKCNNYEKTSGIVVLVLQRNVVVFVFPICFLFRYEKYF
jgi:hypothetical protein